MGERIDCILEKQRAFFAKEKTYDLNYRISALKKLKNSIQKYEHEIAEALKTDLGKSEFESYMCETGMALSEITHMLKHIKKYSKPSKVKTPVSQFYSVSKKIKDPLGNVLIISPWNYPFLLTFQPLIDAIAAGNTAVLKPSTYSPATSEITVKIISETFPEEYVAVVTGGRAENISLLKKKFDLVFFTGSENVGKEVLRNTAENLTPAVLELGGKSPCIVDESAKIPLAAKRIVFGKYLNCGQTCVAPDYILCKREIRDQFVNAVKAEIKKQFGENPLDNKLYGKIINRKHFDRLLSLIDKEKVVIGGGYDEEKLRIEPTVMTDITFEDRVMGEEIFGPIMPVLSYDNIEDVISKLREKPKPLALYIFSENKETVKRVTERCRFGGGCVNDTIIHLAVDSLGFGGVGESGMGAYHGETGFNTFSHIKGIVDKKTFLDIPLRYQPYKNGKNEKMLRKFLK